MLIASESRGMLAGAGTIALSLGAAMTPLTRGAQRARVGRAAIRREFGKAPQRCEVDHDQQSSWCEYRGPSRRIGLLSRGAGDHRRLTSDVSTTRGETLKLASLGVAST